jgi:hypothetical protein
MDVGLIERKTLALADRLNNIVEPSSVVSGVTALIGAAVVYALLNIANAIREGHKGEI